MGKTDRPGRGASTRGACETRLGRWVRRCGTAWLCRLSGPVRVTDRTHTAGSGSRAGPRPAELADPAAPRRRRRNATYRAHRPVRHVGYLVLPVRARRARVAAARPRPQSSSAL